MWGQLDYLNYSMRPGQGEWFRRPGYSDYYLTYSNFISSNESVKFLTQVFFHSYERAGVPHMERRLEAAERWDAYFS